MKKILLSFILILPFSVCFSQFSEGFEGNFPATDWTYYYANEATSAGNYFNRMIHSTATFYSGNKSFRFCSRSPSPTPKNQYLITPRLGVHSPDSIVFWYRNANAGVESFSVGISSSGTSISDFLFGPDVVVPNSGWIKYVYPVPVGTEYISIHYKNQNQQYLYIDNVTAPPLYLPPCQLISLSSFGTSHDSTNITWQSGLLDSAWTVEYGLSGFTIGNGTVINSTEDTVSINGLLSKSNYDIYVKSNCSVSGPSSWVGPITINTTCSPIVKAPWLDEVEGHAITDKSIINNCWSSVPYNTYTGYKWNVHSGETYTSNTGPLAAKVGTKYFHTYASNSSMGDTAQLYTPQINLDTLSVPALSFYYHMFGDHIGDLAIDVFDGTTWNNNVFVISGEQQTNILAPWRKQGVDLSSYSGIIQIRFSAYQLVNGQRAHISIDNIEIKNAPNCYDPSDLKTFNVSYNSINATWLSNPMDSVWELEYGPTGFSQGLGTIITTTNDSLLLNGLSANTTYDVYLKSICYSGSASEWIGPFIVKTNCLPTNAIWADDIELQNINDTANVSNCWTTIPSNTDLLYRWNTHSGSTPSAQFGTGPSGAHSGSKYFYTEASKGREGDIAELYTPMVDLDTLSNPALSFYYHMHGNGMGTLAVDVFDGVKWDDSVFYITGEQQTDTLSPWKQQWVDLSAYSGIIQLRFSGRKNTAATTTGDISIDDIEVKNGLTCYNPENVSIFDISTDSFNITWESNLNDSIWLVEYGQANYAFGTGTRILSNNDTISINGLSPSLYYDVYIKSICSIGDSSVWIGPFSVKTSCDPIKLAPWKDDVELHKITSVSNIENCWSSIPSNALTSDYRWNVGTGRTPSGNTGPSGAKSHDKYFYIEASGSSEGDIAELYSPMIDLTSLSTPQLSFYYHMYGATTGSLIVDVFDGNIWNDSVFVIVGEQQGAYASSWIKQEINLLGYSDTIQIRFKSYRGSGYTGDISIDDIEVRDIPTCFEQTNLSVFNVSYDTIDVTWVDQLGDSIWELEYGPAGFTKGTGTLLTSINDSATIYGLSPITSYDVYIRSYCSINDSSSWSFPFTFETKCYPIVSAPWLDDFESHPINTSSDIVTNCWSLIANTGYRWNVGFNQTPNHPHTGPQSANSGNRFVYTDGLGSWSETELYTPMIDLNNLSTPALSFYYHMFGSGIGVLDVDVFDGTTWNNDVFVIRGSQQATQPSPWIQKIIDLSAYSDTIQIRFTAHEGNNWNGNISLDDIEINNLPCSFPANSVLLDLYEDSVSISWNSQSSDSIWELEYGPSGYAFGTGNLITLNSNPAVVNGLSPNTEYDFYIRSFCTTMDTSIWEGPFSGVTRCESIITPPYSNDFELLTSVSNPLACEATEYMTKCFTNDLVYNKINWVPFSGATPTPLSGPSGDNSSGSGNYLYLESDGCFNSTNTLNTPYFDLTGIIDPKVEFAYHMYGNDVGNLKLVAYTQSGASYPQFIKTGNQGDFWFDTTIQLSSLIDSTVRFAIIGQTGLSNTSDIAIDDFKVYGGNPSSVNEKELLSQLVVFPNPNNGNFKILNKGNNISSIISIIDVQGRIVYTKNISLKKSTPEEIHLNNLTKGLYFVQIETKELIIQKKIIIH